MKRTGGFTLIELVVVLAIVAVLAAVLTPLAVNWIEQSRITRAMADGRTIADAIRLYKGDTGYFPIYATLAEARSATNNTHKLSGPGNAPINGHADWSSYTSTSDVVIILNTNLGFSTGSEVKSPGRAAYRGPYIGSVDSDPWGNAFIVTASNLNSGTNRGFVISAGPDGTLDTDPTQGAINVTAANDDIVVPIN